MSMVPANSGYTPQVSVLMAVYNTEAFLSRAIESILCQTITDLELIIVEDCATDNSPAIISDWAARDPRIKTIRNEQNLGLSKSLNRGLSLARGAFITRQDSDDYSLPERLTTQLHFLESWPDVGAVGTTILFVDDKDELMGTDHFPTENEVIQQTLPDMMCFCGPTLLIRRSQFETCGLYFDERFSGSDDYDLCLRLAEVTELGNVDEPLYAYRQHSHSMSHTRRYDLMFKKAAALEEAGRRRFAENPPDSFMLLIARDYQRAAVLAYASGQMAEAEASLQKALAVRPTLLAQAEPVATTLRRYLPTDGEQAISFVKGIFTDLLPSNQHLAKLRAHLLAELHMNEVFTGVNQHQPQRIDAHLWPGIRQNPRWLLNRGVAALAAKRLLRLT